MRQARKQPGSPGSPKVTPCVTTGQYHTRKLAAAPSQSMCGFLSPAEEAEGWRNSPRLPAWTWHSRPLAHQGPTSHCLMNCRRPVPLFPIPSLEFSFLPHKTSHIEETKEAVATTSEAAWGLCPSPRGMGVGAQPLRGPRSRGTRKTGK